MLAELERVYKILETSLNEYINYFRDERVRYDKLNRILGSLKIMEGLFKMEGLNTKDIDTLKNLISKTSERYYKDIDKSTINVINGLLKSIKKVISG